MHLASIILKILDNEDEPNWLSFTVNKYRKYNKKY